MAAIITSTCCKHISAAFEYLKIVVVVPTAPDSYTPSIKRYPGPHKCHVYLVREIAEIGSSCKTCTSIILCIDHVISTAYKLASISGCAIASDLPLMSLAVPVQWIIQHQRPAIRWIGIRAGGNGSCRGILFSI